MGIGEI